jgi:hypothetical protein
MRNTKLNSLAAANHVCTILDTVAKLPFYIVVCAVLCCVNLNWVWGAYCLGVRWLLAHSVYNLYLHLWYGIMFVYITLFCVLKLNVFLRSYQFINSLRFADISTCLLQFSLTLLLYICCTVTLILLLNVLSWSQDTWTEYHHIEST